MDEIKQALKDFWTDMQDWVGASPVKSTVLAVVCMLVGSGINGIFT